MENFDYEKLGLKSGLEIHQQLDTSKLFCRCPSLLRQDDPDFIVKRKLHAIAGESGNVDLAAEYQASKNKEFVYQGYDTTCLVELDEEPPHEINSESLKIVLEISLLLNCKIMPITQIMRKTVIDGSNTTGFQRTVLIAKDGYVETEFGRVGIDGIFLEEDAARPISKSEKQVIYRLDRLGIPMIEIATAPDIKNPEQAREVALHIGDVLRSCKVRRGLGTIRQDVNLSIKGGVRTELKGVQNPDLIISTMNNEIERQLKLIEKEEKIESTVRKPNPDGTTEFLRPMPGADRMYPETDLPLLKIKKSFIDEVKKNLPKLRSEEINELKKKGLSEEMIKLLLKQNKLDEFKSLLGIYSDINFIAKLILLFPKEISKKLNKDFNEVNEVAMDFAGDILSAIKKKKINEEDAKEVLMKIVSGKNFKDAIKIEKHDLGSIEEKIHKMIKEKPGLNPNAYMGLVMKEFKGKVDGGGAMRIIKKFTK
ncbi:MAG: Glu-tRNA(Gln) amidotransferase subunit GatE [Candidatus Pacearchaeota archaeon]|jgi:Glu-tRNA(Gln) amidotransferase subunit E-like FAD-binding protein